MVKIYIIYTYITIEIVLISLSSLCSNLSDCMLVGWFKRRKSVCEQTRTGDFLSCSDSSFVYIYHSTRTGVPREMCADKLPGMKFLFEFGKEVTVPNMFYNVLTVLL